MQRERVLFTFRTSYIFKLKKSFFRITHHEMFSFNTTKYVQYRTCYVLHCKFTTCCRRENVIYGPLCVSCLCNIWTKSPPIILFISQIIRKRFFSLSCKFLSEKLPSIHLGPRRRRASRRRWLRSFSLEAHFLVPYTSDRRSKSDLLYSHLLTKDISLTWPLSGQEHARKSCFSLHQTRISHYSASCGGGGIESSSRSCIP